MNPLLNKRLVLFLFKKYRLLVAVVLLCGGLLVFLIITAFNTRSKVIKKLGEDQVTYEDFRKKLFASQAVNKLLIDKQELLDSFLPDKFELLRVLNVLETISSKTKFKIESFSISPPQEIPGQRVEKRIDIKGSGTFNEFLNFIKEYKYISGQILSVDSLNLTGRDEIVSNLSITLYAYEPKIDFAALEPGGIDTLDEKLINLIEQNVEIVKEIEIKDDYKNKTNPFE